MLANTHSANFNIANIVVPEPSTAADNDLRRRVKTFLSTSHRPGLRALEVEAHGGVVRLRGKVKTFYEKQLSAQLAQRVAGVVRLIDEVIVKLPQVEPRHEIVTVRLGSGTLGSGTLDNDAERATFREGELEISRTVF
jgi:BON domain